MSKNNTIANNPIADIEEHDSDAESDHNYVEQDPTTLLELGRNQILRTIRDLFLTQNQVVLMGDWNGLKHSIVGFMENLGATLLVTEPTYSSVRNPKYTYHNDLIFTKGLHVEHVKQLRRGFDSFSDHDAIVFKLKNTAVKKGKLK